MLPFTQVPTSSRYLIVRIIFSHSATFSLKDISLATIVLRLCSLILNNSKYFYMASVFFFSSLQPHLTNSSSSATLTFISIILQTLSPLSFSLLPSFNLAQHVSFPIHDTDNILHLVVTSADTSLAPAVSFTHWSPSDHFPSSSPGCL